MRYVFLLILCIIAINSPAQHYRLKTLTHERYSDGTLKFMPIDTFNYTYSYGKGGVIPYAAFVANEKYGYHIHLNYNPYFVPDLKYDSCLIVNADFSGKQFHSVVKQHFDSDDNIVLRNLNSILTPKFLQTDSFSYASNRMNYSYETIAGYYNRSIKSYHYNSLGQLDTVALGSFMKTVYVYNTIGTVYRVFNICASNIDALFNNLRSTYNYNTSGQLTAIIHDRYDTISATFNRNSSREFYTYTTANDTDEILSQNWDYKTSGWVNDTKKVFLFDANHNVLFNVLIEWKNNAWDTFRCSAYGYNAQNQLTFNETKFWDKSKHSWEYKSDTFAFGNSQRFTFTYEPYHFSLAVNKSEDDNSIKLFPVPASGVLNIEVKKDFKNPFKATILDMQGRLYTEWAEEPCNEYSRSIPIDNLPNGMYCLKLMSEDGEIAKQFMVER